MNVQVDLLGIVAGYVIGWVTAISAVLIEHKLSHSVVNSKIEVCNDESSDG